LCFVGILFACLSVVLAVNQNCANLPAPLIVDGGTDVALSTVSKISTNPTHTYLHALPTGKINSLSDTTALTVGQEDYWFVAVKKAVDSTGTVTGETTIDMALTCSVSSTWQVTLGGGSSGGSISCVSGHVKHISVSVSDPDVTTHQTLTVQLESGGPSTYVLAFCQPNGENGGDPTVFGDPHFLGFYGQRFDFNGQVDTTYNLYSDKVISLSTTFGGDHRKQTFMRAFGLLLGSTPVTWELKVQPEEKAKWDLGFEQLPSFTPTLPAIEVAVNGTVQSLPANKSILLGCATLMWDGAQFSLSYGAYALKTKLRYLPLGHLETTREAYFDLTSFSVPPQPRILRQGGLLGFTLVPSWPGDSSDILEEAFTVPALLSTNCQACKKPTQLTCIGSTPGRSSSVKTTPESA